MVFHCKNDRRNRNHNRLGKFLSGLYIVQTVMQKKYWIRAKQILEYRYPKTKVISINPVGLRGLFKDVYTQSYVDAHPELKNENIEILKPELCETALHN